MTAQPLSRPPFCKFRTPSSGRRVVWEVTGACDLMCHHCIFSSGGKNRRGELSTEDCLCAVKTLAMSGASHFKVTGGEPLVRPDILEICHAISSSGSSWDISTNANLVKPEMARKIAAAKPVFASVSLDGPGPSSHDSIRGEGAFNLASRGARLLSEAGCNLRIGCAIHAGCDRLVMETAFCAKEMGASEIVFSMMEPAGRLPPDSPLLSKRPVSEILRDIGAARLAIGGITVSSSIPILQHTHSLPPAPSHAKCPGGSSMLFLDRFGTLRPCTWAADRGLEGSEGIAFASWSGNPEAAVFPKFQKLAESMPGMCPADRGAP